MAPALLFFSVAGKLAAFLLWHQPVNHAVSAGLFVLPDFLGGAAWATWGRLRYNHTQGILFGFLGNAFFASGVSSLTPVSA